MYTSNQVPIHHDPETQPVKPHRATNYYAHRVGDSLTTRICKILCAISLFLVVSLGITSFVLWLTFRPHKPRFHVRDFTIPGFDNPDGFENVGITFNVTSRNANKKMGFFYGRMEASINYKDEMIASETFMGSFYQESKSTKIVTGVLDGASFTSSRNRWVDFVSDRVNGTVGFRLDVTSVLHFNVAVLGFRQHRVHADCAVAVGRDGRLLPSHKNKRCPVYYT